MLLNADLIKTKSGTYGDATWYKPS